MTLEKKDRIKGHVPNYFRPTINRTWKAVLEAIGTEDDKIIEQLGEAKDQLYVEDADGRFLDVLGANVGVKRTREVPINDDSFRELIPILSFFFKQVRPTIYEALEVFWGENSTRANVISSNLENYNLSGGEILNIKVDNTRDIEIKFLAADFENAGAATAEEVAKVITDRGFGLVTGIALRDNISGDDAVLIRTSTRGALGKIQVIGGSANSILGFSTSIVERTDISIYEINHKEIVIRLPSTLPLILNSLKGSHHFHPTTTEILDGNPTSSADPYWAGSFIFDTFATFDITSIKTTLNEIIQSDSNVFTIEVIDASSFPNSQGNLVFNFGNPKQEGPIPYLARPNNTSLLIDPSYIFNRTHAIGDEIHFVDVPSPKPSILGDDFAVFITNTSNVRELALELIRQIIAAGITIRFQIIDPDYLFDEIIC